MLSHKEPNQFTKSLGKHLVGLLMQIAKTNYVSKNRPSSLDLAILEQWAKTWKKVHFGRTMYCLPQRLKLTFFEKISSGGSLNETRSGEKISKNVDFSIWDNRASTVHTNTFDIGYFCTLAHRAIVFEIHNWPVPDCNYWLLPTD